jgi:hypothetical protein
LVLATLALGIVGAVLMDVLSLGPRRRDDSAAAAVPLIQTPATTVSAENAIAEVIGSANPEAVIAPIRTCSPTTLMPLGDSLTAGWEGYRGPLFRALEARRIPVDFVGSIAIDPAGGGDPDSESHPGFLFGPDMRVDVNAAPVTTTSTTAVAQPGDVAAAPSTPRTFSENAANWFAAKPSVAVILLGSEELSEASTRVAAPAAYEALIAHIRERSPGTLLVLTELPPSSRFDEKNPALVALNSKMKQLAAVDRNDLIYFAAVNQKLKQLRFDPTKDLTEDQFRFTPSGGQKFAIALEPFISGAIIRDRSRRCAAVRQPTTTITTTTTTSTRLAPDLFSGNDDFIAEDSGFVTNAP